MARAIRGYCRRHSSTTVFPRWAPAFGEPGSAKRASVRSQAHPERRRGIKSRVSHGKGWRLALLALGLVRSPVCSRFRLVLLAGWSYRRVCEYTRAGARLPQRRLFGERVLGYSRTAGRAVSMAIRERVRRRHGPPVLERGDGLWDPAGE